MHVKRCPNGKKRYTLSITNTEVRTVFDEIVTEIFSSSESDYSEFSEALLLGDNMFGTLKMYHDKDFFQAHRKIQFDTLYETGLYEAVAVLKTRILNENEEGFRYYQFFNYQNEREFQKCLEFIEKNQMFGTDSTLEYGDHILMLSTCEYSQENGRLVIVARKMN